MQNRENLRQCPFQSGDLAHQIGPREAGPKSTQKLAKLLTNGRFNDSVQLLNNGERWPMFFLYIIFKMRKPKAAPL